MPGTPGAEPRFALELRELRLRLGEAWIIRGVSFSLRQGERVALLGPNGAGKTTLLRLIAGAVRPTAGTIDIALNGKARPPWQAQRAVGLLGHQTYLFGDLTVDENLRLYATLFDLAEPEKRLERVLCEVGMGGRRHERVDRLSRGQQQRCALARAILHEPRLLLLDEPETGLDLEALGRLESILASQPDRAVMLATHNLVRAQQLAERAVVLVNGTIVADCPPAELTGDRLAALFQGGPTRHARTP